MNAASQVPSAVLISTSRSVTGCCASTCVPAAAASPAATVSATKSRLVMSSCSMNQCSSGANDTGAGSRRERILVGARAVHGRDRHVEQPQIDDQLAAMVIPMVEHHRAHEVDSRHRQERPGTIDHAPLLQQEVVGPLAEATLRVGHAV